MQIRFENVGRIFVHTVPYHKCQLQHVSKKHCPNFQSHPWQSRQTPALQENHGRAQELSAPLPC